MGNIIVFSGLGIFLVGELERRGEFGIIQEKLDWFMERIKYLNTHDLGKLFYRLKNEALLVKTKD
jgi:hypothetical protein